MRLSSSLFALSSRLHWEKDIVFMPTRYKNGASMRHSNSQFIKMPWYIQGLKDHFGRDAEEIYEHPQLALLVLTEMYLAQYRGSWRDSQRKHRRAREPQWMGLLDSDTRCVLRRAWVTGNHFDPLAIVPSIPYTGISYAVAEDGPMAAVTRALGLFRLSNIKQLGALHHPANTDITVDSPDVVPQQHFLGGEFNHTRWVHVLDVSAVATLIGKNVALTPEELLHLRAAALSHDGLTPAGGDTTKAVDMQGLDEDLHYPELLKRSSEWPEVRDRLGLSDDLLYEIIMNKGRLGLILDIADKVAYVARDLYMYRAYGYESPAHAPADYGFSRVYELSEQNKLICSIWDQVDIRNGQLYFRNSEALADFLEVRAWLARNVYNNPRSRFREHTLGTVFTRFLYETGQITRQQLLTWADEYLNMRLEELVGADSFMRRSKNHFLLNVDRFATAAEADRREAELVTQGKVVLVESVPARVKTGGHFLVEKNGTLMPLRDAEQKRHDEIMEIATTRYPWYVYSFPLREVPIPEKSREAFDAYQRRRISNKKGATATPGI